VLLTAAAPAADAPDGASLMLEGNALFRSGLYRAALLRYREASASGLDSALLDYNLGVTHYRLDQYPEAERALERASQDVTLRALAAYNLGLTHRAAGRTAEAQRWFDTAATAADDGDLQRLARRAAESVHEQPRTITAEARASVRQGFDAPIGQFNLRVTAAYGEDDNVNRTPSEPYVDLSQPDQPLITPEPVAGTYTPVNLLAEYVLHNEAGDSDFVFAYELDGDYYPWDELANDEETQRLHMGANVVLGERDNRRRTLQSAFFMTKHFQLNFDTDDGIDRDINGFDISTRFMYTSAGIEGEFDHRLGDWQWGFNMRLERREYETPPIVTNYDNELYFVKASVGYELNDATALSFGLSSYRRAYDQRLARDLGGVLLSTNAALEYDYQGVELGVRRRLLEFIDLEFDYRRLDRTDQFLGYNDYTQDVIGLHAVFRPNGRFLLSLGATSRVYDYVNAFAFNEPAAGPKELEDLSGELFAEFHLTKSWSISARMAISDVTSTDTRAEYSRAQTALGLTWRR
jgi:tetratricopeptide (TPR) repeat protein